MENKLFLALFLSLILSVTAVFAEDEVMDVKLDKNIYSPGDNIEITGILFSGNLSVPNENVTILFNGSLSYDETDSDGYFEKTLIAPSENGEYIISITYESLTINKTIKVKSISYIELAIISSASESYEVMTFNSDMASVGITGNGTLTGTLLYSTFSNNGTTYYAILQMNDANGEYDTLFISTLANFATIKFQYLEKGSQIGLNSINYNVFYIDPNGAKAIILRQINPVFYGSGSETAKLFILATNATKGIISSTTNLTVEQIDEDKNYENITSGTLTPTEVTISQYYSDKYTTYYGMKVQDLSISTTAGKHDIIVEGTSIVSYFVEKYTLKAIVENLEGTILSTASREQTIVLKSSVVDLNNGSAVSSATIRAKIIYPEGNETTMSLSNNGQNIFTANLTIDSTQTGEYIVIFTANYSGDIIKKEYRFYAKSGDLFMKAFSKEKGEGEGFAPSSEGIIIIGGKDLENDGEFMNLTTETDNCNSTLIRITGIFDENKFNRISSFNVMNMSNMIDTKVPAEERNWIRDEMESIFGENACAINFTTPNITGTYKIEAEANLSGTVYKMKDYMDVTSLFIYGMPANCYTGSWTGSASPGARICIKPTVYNSQNGRIIANSNITDFSLIEVYSIEDNLVITDEIENVSIVTFSNGNRGLSFFSSENSVGDHDVKFKIKANVSGTLTSGVGRSWYRTELWSVYTYPDCSSQGNNKGFCNFGSDSSVTLKVDAFSAGYGSGQADLTAVVTSVKNFETGETISLSGGEDSSCTTVADNSSSSQTSNNSQTGGVVKPATCTLTIQAPNEGWSSGGHEVKITITDEDENSMSVYSWFSVQNFMFYAWNRNWEMTTGQEAVFQITSKTFNGTNIPVDVEVSKLYYMGSEDKWMEPREVSITATTQSINGNGDYIIGSGNLTGLKSGFYELNLKATTGEGDTQTARVGFNIKSFVAVSNPTENDNWNHAYEIDGNMTINITAFSSINWSTWPPTGTIHPITNASVRKIYKNGMWNSAYKQSGKDTIGDSAECSENSCILTVPLSGFEQTSYDMEILVSDGSGSTTVGYWFRTEMFTITTPEINDWRTVATANKMTDKMMITLSTDKTCGTSSDSITEPANVTNCLVEARNLPTINTEDYNTDNKKTILLLDKTNASMPKLYVNVYNETRQTNAETHFNFTIGSMQPVIIGETFTDTNGYIWNFTAVDVGLGKITLKSVNGVVRSRTKQAGEGQSEVAVEYPYQYLVNKSMSQSGVFLFYGNANNDWEDKFWDEQWSQVDLDGDDQYNCDPSYNHSGSTCEEYFMLLSDRQVSGRYDTLFLSPTRNITQGVDSYNGLTGSGDIRLNSSANPIYLLNMIYSETNGAGIYRIVLTTNKEGWAGRNLGIFKVGSESIKVPVMVLSPSTRAPLANKTILIRTLRTYGSINFEETELTLVTAETGANGIALLDINTSSKPSGEYSIIMEVNNSGTIVTSGNDYNNPVIELRSFAISNLFGLKATIDNMEEWSVAAGNLFKADSSQSSVGNEGLAEVRLQCNDANNEPHSWELCHADDWMYKEIWVNITDPTNVSIITDPTKYDWYLSDSDVENSIGGLKRINDTVTISDDFSGDMNYRFIDVTLDPTQETFIVGVPRTIPNPGTSCNFNITLESVDYAGGNIVWTVKEICPWSNNYITAEQNQTHSINEERFMWSGLFNISAIDSGEQNATFNVFKKTITLMSPVPQQVIDDLEPNNDMIRIISNYNSLGYDLYIYNSDDRQTQNDIQGWSGSLDSVAVVEIANSSNVQIYAFGEPITDIGDKAVVRADAWNQYVYLSNFTVNGEIIYPLPWSCDDEVFYAGYFSEETLGFNMYDCGEEDPALSDNINYILLFDSMCDGVSQITNAKFDDDPVIDDAWVNSGDYNGPYDFDGPERGSVNLCQDNSGERNASEQWMEIGRESWPMSITGYNDISIGILDLFRVKWGVNQGENITSLDLWVQAKNFDGSIINGTISVKKAVGNVWSCGMSQEEDINVTATGGELVNGIGYINVDLSQSTSTQPTLKFKINDSSSGEIERAEYVTKSFWYSPAEENMVYDEQCGDFFKDDAMMDGEGYFEMNPEDQEEMMRCNDAGYDSCDETTGCGGVLKDEFKIGEPMENVCLPCFAFDKAGNETCSSKPKCQWFDDPEEGGYCDPAEEGPV